MKIWLFLLLPFVLTTDVNMLPMQEQELVRTGKWADAQLAAAQVSGLECSPSSLSYSFHITS